MNFSPNLESSIQRLFPHKDIDEALAELLLERAQKNLLKYQVIARQFQAKYDQDFEAFRKKILYSEPAFELEQDYFDWELAVTGIADMETEIKRLKGSQIRE
jgi:hypothetical protein